MVKDTEEEEKEEKEKEKQKEAKVSWFDKVPITWKILGGGLLLIRYQSLVASGNTQQIWVWVVGIIIGWYMIGAEGKKRISVVLSPEEAEDELKKEITRKIKKGQISRWVDIHIGPNNGLFYNEGMPKYYQIGVEIKSDGQREYKRGLVFAEGPTKGYAVLQDHPGKVTGRELIPVRTPAIFKTLKKYDLDIDKFVMGSE